MQLPIASHHIVRIIPTTLVLHRQRMQIKHKSFLIAVPLFCLLGSHVTQNENPEDLDSVQKVSFDYYEYEP